MVIHQSVEYYVIASTKESSSFSFSIIIIIIIYKTCIQFFGVAPVHLPLCMCVGCMVVLLASTTSITTPTILSVLCTFFGRSRHSTQYTYSSFSTEPQQWLCVSISVDLFHWMVKSLLLPVISLLLLLEQSEFGCCFLQSRIKNKMSVWTKECIPQSI